MENDDFQLDMFEEKREKKQETLGKQPLRTIITVKDMTISGLPKPPAYRVIRLNPREVLILNEGSGL